jgi:hypothetical protein
VAKDQSSQEDVRTTRCPEEDVQMLTVKLMHKHHEHRGIKRCTLAQWCFAEPTNNQGITQPPVTECLICMKSHSQVGLTSSFCSWGDWGPQRVPALLKDTQLLRSSGPDEASGGILSKLIQRTMQKSLSKTKRKQPGYCVPRRFRQVSATYSRSHS